MVSPLVFYQLVIFALVWLFVILHITWPKRAVTAPVAPAAPEIPKPKRPRSNEPKLEEQIAYYDAKLKAMATSHPECLRLLTIPGIGPLSADMPPPSDEQVEQWLGEHRQEKYE